MTAESTVETHVLGGHVYQHHTVSVVSDIPQTRCPVNWAYPLSSKT